MNRTIISTRLYKKRLSITEIARRCNIPRRSIYHVLNGTRSFHRVESELEIILEMPIAEIKAAWSAGYKPLLNADVPDDMKRRSR